ncbi:EF-hand domain-containing protein [Chloroflexi bacterium TSY]|nr:EF-hand domain-containing protein [Chloroflexi bacterium TSY]
MTRLFHLYDVNNDGYLSREDYEEVVNNLAKSHGLSSDSSAYKNIYANYMAVWDLLRRYTDNNRDSVVSLDEYLARYDVLLRQNEVFDSIILTNAELIIEVTDTDGDGKVSEEEFVVSLMCHNVSEEDARAAFRHLDVRRYGFLTRSEWLRHIEEFYKSEDPNALGNWLIGPLPEQ